MPMRDVWREPDEESADLYPGIVVHDGRVTGSITSGATRLPLWAIVTTALTEGWPAVEHGWNPTLSVDEFSEFLYNLLELRGEFGRLLLVLAEAERTERSSKPWWHVKRRRKLVAEQLHRCLAVVEDAS